MNPHHFHPSILRAYDIRGIVGETLHIRDAYALGRAFGTRVIRQGGSRICVGYDGRLTSPELEAALTEGLQHAGVNVLRIGRGPTPLLYFSVFDQDTDGGIMITGSHNPPQHNGFKMMLGKQSFFGADILSLGTIAEQADYTQGKGTVSAIDLSPAYLARLSQGPPLQRRLKVAWDAGNGAAGEMMEQLTSRLPGEHILLCETIDGRFPNHHPDPTIPENLALLQQTVREKNCDLGIAFDGDGDRIGAVDNQGEIIWADQLMILWARCVLAETPGATIIADVKASQSLFDEITNLGGTALMGRTGHSLIKDMMVSSGALLAGEMSGHIFFADHYYGFDDGLYAAVRLLRMLAAQPLSLADIRRDFPTVFNTPELRFPCPEEQKFALVEQITTRLQKEGATLETIDGIRVRENGGWWLLRASNTQACLVARCEATNADTLTDIRNRLAQLLNQVGIKPEF